MTGTEVQELVEMERNSVWEEINAPDPAEEQMRNAAKAIGEALELLDKASIKLMEAQSEVEGYPMEYMVGSFYDQLMDYELPLTELKEKYEKGER